MQNVECCGCIGQVSLSLTLTPAMHIYAQTKFPLQQNIGMCRFLLFVAFEFWMLYSLHISQWMHLVAWIGCVCIYVWDTRLTFSFIITISLSLSLTLYPVVIVVVSLSFPFKSKNIHIFHVKMVNMRASENILKEYCTLYIVCINMFLVVYAFLSMCMCIFCSSIFRLTQNWDSPCVRMDGWMDGWLYALSICLCARECCTYIYKIFPMEYQQQLIANNREENKQKYKKKNINRAKQDCVL